MADIVPLLFNSLFTNESYLRKVLPHLQEQYFGTRADQAILRVVLDHVTKYNVCPTRSVFDIALDSLAISQDIADDITKKLDLYFSSNEPVNQDWLVEETERFCRERALYNALMKSVDIVNGNTKEPPSAIVSIMTDALGVSFQTSVGHDYFTDAEERFDRARSETARLPFDIDVFNKITKGGVPSKTLNVVMAPTGVGKSIFLCHLAASYISLHKNVLYITLEMSEDELASRIDANLMDIPLEQFMDMPKPVFLKKIDQLREQHKGRLVIRQYPTGSVSVLHFKALIKELYNKQKFKPDVIIVDYINICASARLKPNNSAGQYGLVKSIAEELRGMAIEENVPVWSATQTNRGGYDNNDVDLTDTSESMGLPMTVDFMAAFIRIEELEYDLKILVKQLKNRYDDMAKLPRFIVGLNKSKMKFFNADDQAQDILHENKAIKASSKNPKSSGKGRAPKFSD